MTRSEQAAEALARANTIRSVVGRERERLRSSAATVAIERAVNLLQAPEGMLARMSTVRLLSAIPGVGDTQVDRLLRHAGIPLGSAAIGDLTSRQVDALVLALRLPSSERKRITSRPIVEIAGPCPRCWAMGRELARLRAENVELGMAAERAG